MADDPLRIWRALGRPQTPPVPALQNLTVRRANEVFRASVVPRIQTRIQGRPGIQVEIKRWA
jgi:hypothetical protein